VIVRVRPTPLAPRISGDELDAHVAFIESLGAKAIWLDYRETSAAA